MGAATACASAAAACCTAPCRARAKAGEAMMERTSATISATCAVAVGSSGGRRKPLHPFPPTSASNPVWMSARRDMACGGVMAWPSSRGPTTRCTTASIASTSCGTPCRASVSALPRKLCCSACVSGGGPSLLASSSDAKYKRRPSTLICTRSSRSSSGSAHAVVAASAKLAAVSCIHTSTFSPPLVRSPRICRSCSFRGVVSAARSSAACSDGSSVGSVFCSGMC
mmetsp:Transcript_3912/g.11360  ORF Transcript_3912/g.11360 Transcript_3912/m.11360 type:complete len:226 (-) Transcript_3912:390-1067(-)